MKIISLIFYSFIILCLSANVYSQSGKIELYNPHRHARAQIDSSIQVAQKEKKHVLLQIGGNWCSWCILFNKLCSQDLQIDSVLKAAYVVEHINYSKENQNLDVLKQLGFPQRFGFPVLVILDANGKRLHTQNTAYLEEGKGYNKEKVLEFFKQWSPAALNSDNYKE
jgi:thioredoxin-related protein